MSLTFPKCNKEQMIKLIRILKSGELPENFVWDFTKVYLTDRENNCVYVCGLGLLAALTISKDNLMGMTGQEMYEHSLNLLGVNDQFQIHDHPFDTNYWNITLGIEPGDYESIIKFVTPQLLGGELVKFYGITEQELNNVTI